LLPELRVVIAVSSGATTLALAIRNIPLQASAVGKKVRSQTAAARLESANDFQHDPCMELILPERLAMRFSSESAALHLAIGLYVAEETTLGQSAEVAHLSQSDFLRALGNRRIPIHYGVEELDEDLRAVEALSRG
jgi:predicted HTH domain antitoxin